MPLRILSLYSISSAGPPAREAPGLEAEMVLSQTMSSISAAWIHCVALFHAGLEEHRHWWYFLFCFHCSEHTAAVNEGLKCVVRHLEDTIDLVLCECVLSGSTSVLISCTLKGYLKMINEYKLIRKKKKKSFCSSTLVECITIFLSTL